MELGSPTLQLLFNVVTITGAASLAAFCYLLRRANQELSSELELRRASERLSAAQTASAQFPAHQAAVQQPFVQQDIREFVAHRSQQWGFTTTGTKLRRV